MKKIGQKQVLDEDNIQYFYSILSKYEMEDNHRGYNISRIDNKLKKKITLKNKAKNITPQKTKNTILFTGKTVASDLLRHIRNAFAHCFIVDTGKEFLFYDKNRFSKCSMDGRMDKAIFYQLIKELNNTRQL